MELELYCFRCDKKVVINQPATGQQAKCPVCSADLTAVSAGMAPAASAPPAEVIYCRKCGLQNRENNFKCTGCGFVLHGQAQQYVIVEDGTMGGLIPYKNAKALWAYYLGIFSLIPCFGILLGIAALILGIKGLKYAKLHPEARGKVHAWTGIIMGILCAAFYVFLLVLIIIGIINRP